MNIFSKTSTFVSFYYFSKCNIYASTLSKGNDLFLLFIFFPALILSRQQFKGMIQIHPPIPPLRVWVLHVFFSSCASLQIIFHAAPGKKRLVIPYDRPFKQKCRDTGGLCGGDTGPAYRTDHSESGIRGSGGRKTRRFGASSRPDPR